MWPREQTTSPTKKSWWMKKRFVRVVASLVDADLFVVAAVALIS